MVSEPVTQDDGDAAHRLRLDHAGQAAQLVERPVRGGVVEDDGHVAVVEDVEGQRYRRVEASQDGDHAHGQRHTEGDPQRRADHASRTPEQAAQHHAAGLVQARVEASGQPPGAAVVRRGGRPHRGGRGQSEDAPQDEAAPGRGRADAHQEPHEERPGVGAEGQGRELEVDQVDAGQSPSRQHAQDAPGRGAQHGDGDDHLEVVESHRQVGVTEGLDQPDLLALGVDHARDDEGEQKRRHNEEDGRYHDAHGAELLELVADEPIGVLIVPPVGAGPPVGIENAIHGVEDLREAGAAVQGQDGLVEGSLHPVGGGNGPAPHPEDAVQGIVRDDLSGRRDVDELRRLRQPHDAQAPARAVHRDGKPVPRLQPASRGEAPEQEDLVGVPGVGHAPGDEEDAVQVGAVHVRKREGPAPDRELESRQVDQSLPDDAPLGRRDAGQRGEGVEQKARRALDRREHVGEPTALVVGSSGLPDGDVQPRHHDQQHDPHGHDRTDGGDLSLHPPEVPDELPIHGRQRDHHSMASGSLRSAFSTTERIAPSAK